MEHTFDDVSHRHAVLYVDGQPWRVTLTWDLVDGQIECTGVRLLSFTEDLVQGESGLAVSRRPLRRSRPRPVSTDVIRRIPWASVIAEERVKQARSVEEIAVSDGLSPKTRALVRRQIQAWRQEAGSHRGRKGYPRAHYEAVAALYVAAQGHAPTKRVADEFKVEKTTAAKWVARARVLGMLPPAHAGKVGEPRP